MNKVGICYGSRIRELGDGLDVGATREDSRKISRIFFYPVANHAAGNILYLFLHISFYTHFSVFQDRYLLVETEFHCCVLSLCSSMYWNFPCLLCSLQPGKVTGSG